MNRFLTGWVRPVFAGLLAAALGVPACSSRDAAGAGSGPGAPGNARMQTVAVAPVEVRPMARSITITAPVEPVRVVGVNSLASATVLRVHVQEGDRVRAGALLAELDTRETAAQLARARATLANAEAAYRRATAMREQEIISEVELEQARAAYSTAQSDVSLWETRFGFGRVTAPGAGLVTAKLVEAGSAVSPNQRMFELADESLYVVRVQVSETDVVHLRGGEGVVVHLDAYPAVPVPGRIRRVFPGADPESRLVPVEIALGTPPSGVRVRPGFLARVRLDLVRLDDALAVPSRAVGGTAGSSHVYVVEGDTVVSRPVTTGLVTEGWTQIETGLAAGDRVVVSAITNLRTGVRVRIVSAETPEDTP